VLYGVENLYTLSFNIIRQLSLLDNLTVNTVEISQWQLATNCMYIDQKVPKTMNVEVMRLWRYLVVQKPTSRRDELSQQLSSGLLCRAGRKTTHSLIIAVDVWKVVSGDLTNMHAPRNRILANRIRFGIHFCSQPANAAID